MRSGSNYLRHPIDANQSQVHERKLCSQPVRKISSAEERGNKKNADWDGSRDHFGEGLEKCFPAGESTYAAVVWKKNVRDRRVGRPLASLVVCSYGLLNLRQKNNVEIAIGAKQCCFQQLADKCFH